MCLLLLFSKDPPSVAGTQDGALSPRTDLHSDPKPRGLDGQAIPSFPFAGDWMPFCPHSGR